MKIAVSSTGQGLKDTVDPRFGRCSYFLLIDTESGDFEAISNQTNVNAQGGAGIQAAELVANKDAEAVITGHCGPKAFSALNAVNIQVYTSQNQTVEEALNAFKNNELQQLNQADVAGHWK